MREIELSRGLTALVDDEDYDRVMSVGAWYADPSRQTYYARHNFWLPGRRCKSLRMHRFITGWDFVDHINGNGLDNRRVNLRQATHAQNSQNRRRRSDNTSGYKGVSPGRGAGKWEAAVYKDGKRYHLGTFTTPQEAARAYDAAAVHHFGDFARLNFPKEFTHV